MMKDRMSQQQQQQQQQQPNTSEEITFSTIETVKKSKNTNKRIIRNTWRGCAVQVNCYDSEGRLQHTETDKHTYQDTDTEYYRWTDRDQPPLIPPPDYDKQVEPFGANRLKTSTQYGADGSVLMVRSTEVASAPIVHWTGETSSRTLLESDGQEFNQQLSDAREKTFYPVKTGGQANVPASVYATDPPLEHGDMLLSHTVSPGPATREIEYKTKESMDGNKWSRTNETLWMASDKYINPSLSIGYGASAGSKNGRMMAPQGGYVENGGGGVTVDDRRKMRRDASKAMYAIIGKDF